MTTKTYDDLLRRCRSVEDWQRFPANDIAVFSIFGTVAPGILRKSHRFIQSKRICFERLLSVLHACGALLGRVPPTVASQGPDFGIDRSVSIESAAWKMGPNQEWLKSEIENLKVSSSRAIIYDPSIDANTIQMLRANLGVAQSNYSWFEEVGRLIDKCRWLYLTLPEIIGVDLLVVASSMSDKTLQEIDELGCVSEAEWIDDIVSIPLNPPNIRSIDKSA